VAAVAVRRYKRLAGGVTARVAWLAASSAGGDDRRGGGRPGVEAPLHPILKRHYLTVL